jgi:hypothetical protein
MILLDIVATAIALVTAEIVKAPAAGAITVMDILLGTVIPIAVEDILALAGITVGALVVVHMGTVAVRPMVTVVVMAAQAATEVILVVMEEGEEEEEAVMVGDAVVVGDLNFAP